MSSFEGFPDLEKGNPQEPVSLAAEEVQGGSDETAKLPQRLERYGAAKLRAMQNLAYIDAVLQGSQDIPFQQLARVPHVSHVHQLTRLREIRPKLRECGNYLGFRQYDTVGKVRLTAANFCKVHLLCPLCAIRRGAKSLKAYLDRFRVIRAENPRLKLSLVTYTVQNGDDLAERLGHLKKCLTELLRRRKLSLHGNRHRTEWKKAVGIVGSFEVTNIGNGWHPHVHMLVLHEERMNAAEMKSEWAKLTGDSHVLRIDPARHPDEPERDFLEVFKYAVKFSDLTPGDNVHAYQVIRDRRYQLLFSAGAFRGVEVPEELTDERLDDLPYVELFYRYIDGLYHLAPEGANFRNE